MKTITKTVTVYISDSGDEYSYPTDCLIDEMCAIQDRFKAEISMPVVRSFEDLARVISREPKLLDKLEELALLCGMEPRTKEGE